MAQGVRSIGRLLEVPTARPFVHGLAELPDRSYEGEILAHGANEPWQYSETIPMYQRIGVVARVASRWAAGVGTGNLVPLRLR